MLTGSVFTSAPEANFFTLGFFLLAAYVLDGRRILEKGPLKNQRKEGREGMISMKSRVASDRHRPSVLRG